MTKGMIAITAIFLSAPALGQQQASCLGDKTDVVAIALCACYNITGEFARLGCYDRVLLAKYKADALEAAKARVKAGEMFDLKDEIHQLVN